MGDPLLVSLLGPVSVVDGGRTVAVTSRPQRAVLACLALEVGRVVSIDTLVDALWPDGPPDNALGNVHSYVSKLRRHVGAERIRREHGGYRLVVAPDAVDVRRAERMAESAATLDAPSRAALLSDALALWRGEPLADLGDVPVVAPERTRLVDLHRRIERERMAALLDAGRPDAVLPDLRRAVAVHPHDDAVAALLAEALHASGRSAEALRAIADARRRLAEDTGLEAGAALARAEQRILHGRPADTSEPPATEWPRYTTTLHGRDDDLRRLDELVRPDHVVTLVGAGGIGKTRLACVLADRRRGAGQAVHFLSLAAFSPDDDLGARLAGALQVRVGAAEDPLDAVHERLGHGGQLLVLDNCEHLLDRCRELVDSLCRRRTDLSVFATSRSPLGLPSERVERLGPLDEDGAGRDLFLERAQRVRPDVGTAAADDDAVRSVVRGLGGLPLAIELAAGRMASVSLADLAARVGDLDFLVGGRPTERHATLRHAIDWSYRLLPVAHRRLLCALSLFPAGVDLETAESLAVGLSLPGGGSAEVLDLVDASLLDAEFGRSSRYTMLEPVRAFAGERLAEEGWLPQARRLRAEWARRTSAWIAEAGRSPREAAADARLRADLLNLRAAHRAARSEDDLGTAITISAALIRPTTARDLPEVWSWALELADHPRLALHPRAADALGSAATAAWLTGDLHRGMALANDGLRRDPTSVPSLQAAASLRLLLGDPASAHDLWIAASRADGAYLPQAALAAVYAGDATRAREALATADAWAADVGSPSEAALCRYAWGELLGPDRDAVRCYEEAIDLAASVGAGFVVAISRVGLASTLAANGDHLRATDEYDAVVRYWRRTGNWTQQWTTLRNVADLLDALDRSRLATRLRDAADAAPSSASEGETGPAGVVPPRRQRERPDELVALVLAELADLRRMVATSPEP